MDVLQGMVNGNYNKRPHSSLPGHMAPSDVTSQNESLVWKRMYVDTARRRAKPSRRPKKFTFELGDRVRLSKVRSNSFVKGYASRNLTVETFEVVNRYVKGMINCYKLKDLLDEPVRGVFYEREMQKVENLDDPDQLWRIEKVTRRNNKTGQVLVKWDGFPDKFNSWVNAKDLEHI